MAAGGLGTLVAQPKPYIEQLESIDVVGTTIINSLFLPASQNIAFTDTANKIRFVTLNPLQEAGTSLVVPAKPTVLSVSPSGKTLFVGMENGTVYAVNVNAPSLEQKYTLTQNSLVALSSVDDEWLIAAGSRNEVMITNIAMERSLQKMSPFTAPITSMSIHPSKKFFVIGTQSGTVYYVAVNQLKITNTLTPFAVPVTTVLFSPDGKFLIAGSANGNISVWETTTFSSVATLTLSEGVPVRLCAIDSAAQWLLSASTENNIDIVDLKKLVSLGAFPLNKGQLVGLSFLGTEVFASVSASGTITRWRILPLPPDTIAPTIVLDNPVYTSEETAAKFYGTGYIISGIVYDDNDVTMLRINGKEAQLVPLAEEKTGVPEGMKAKRFSMSVQPDSFGIFRYDIECKDEAEHTAQQSFYVRRLSQQEAVEIITPAPNAETDLISIPLRFKTWFDIGTYSISVNMADIVSNQEPGFDVVNNEVTETIPLLVGYNQVQLSVRSKGGETFTYSLGITRKTGFSAPVASGEKKPRSAGSGPQRWAVVVGVSEYQNSGIPSLKYADKDAEAFANFLRRPQGGGFDSDHMRVLLNKDATLANIKDALINFLSQAIDMDLVIIYFAGHGAPEPGRPQNMYLLTYDSNPGALGTTAFPMWDIQTVLARYITAKRIIVFTDACHSGGISVEFATRGLGVTESNLVNQYLADLAKSKEGTVVFTASAAGEVSQEFPEFGHGVFTYFLLQGMEGKADYNNDYTITINELMQYVEEQVKRKTRGAQNPTRSQTHYDKDMTIAIIPH